MPQNLLLRTVQTKHAPSAIGPYSQAVRVGSMVYVSGQIPLDPVTGQLVKGTIEEQTTRCLENLRAILEASQSDFSRVVKTTVFLKNMDQFTKVNETYGRFFKEPYPARACVEVARLPQDVDVEIDCIAVCEPIA